jgi:hypothetical protein
MEAEMYTPPTVTYMNEVGTTLASDVVDYVSTMVTNIITLAEEQGMVHLGTTLSSATLLPGNYTYSVSGMTITGNLTFNGLGNANSTWIIAGPDGGGTTFNTGSKIHLINSASLENIMWISGYDLNFVAPSGPFFGNFFVLAGSGGVGIDNGVTIYGRLYGEVHNEGTSLVSGGGRPPSFLGAKDSPSVSSSRTLSKSGTVTPSETPLNWFKPWWMKFFEN